MQQGYGYGYQQGYDYQQQQGGYQQQQQWGYAQQGYPQQQQQWGYGQQGQYYDPYQQQQAYYEQQQQQMRQQQQQQQQRQQFGDYGKGGKGGGGKGFEGMDQRDMRDSRDMRDTRDMRDSRGGAAPAGGKGGAAAAGGKAGGGGAAAGGSRGGKGGASEMTYEEYKAAQAAKKQQQAQAKKEAGGQLTLEEYQAQQAAKKAARAAAAASGPSAAAPPRIQERGTKLEEAPAEPAPAAKEEPAPAAEEAAADDWEAQAADEEPAAKEEPPAPVVEEKAPEPEPVKEEPTPPPAKKEAAPAPAPEPEPVDDEPEAVEEEKAAAAKPGGKDLAAPDPRAHLNVVFIGHVDAGKSTTCGNVLYLSGCVDERTIEKYQREAKDKNRESWFLAYIMDTNEEEKAKGKTVEVGRAHFETEHRRWTILDAPGHKSYVPNMIAGASQADMGVLIISARKGEFETGFERGGQTREHALLAKTLGVDKLVVAVNKMDDVSVEWKQERFDEIVKKLTPFLKQSGFKEEQVIFLPISGLTGDNIKERKGTPDWFTGKTLLDLLDSLEVPKRSADLPLRIPMLDGFRDMGAITAIGKVEQGTVKPGMKCTVMPMGHKCTVVSVYINEVEMQYASCGENVTMKMNGVTEEQLMRGFVLSSVPDPVKVVTKFKAQLHLIELPEERPVLTAGYKAIVHVHVAMEECEILKLYESMSVADRKKKEKNPRFVRENSIVTCSIQLARPTPVDIFSGVAQLGRFTMRDEGRTIAIGKITELPKDK